MVYMICNLYTASSQSSTSSNSTHTGAAASTSAGNNNGCPSFPTHCDPNCLALDGMGCPICSCPKSKKRNFVPRNIITTKPPLFYIHWFGVVSYTALRCGLPVLFKSSPISWITNVNKFRSNSKSITGKRLCTIPKELQCRMRPY